jgi:hypothetical protein
MKTKLTTLALALIIICSATAQDKKYSFQVEKGTSFIDLIAIAEKGVIIHGMLEKNNPDGRIIYLDKDLNLKWNIPRSKHSNTAITMNSSGSKIYYLDDAFDRKMSTMSFKEINADDGSIRSCSIKKEKWKVASPGNLKATFATDSVICYISSKYGNETHPKKKAEEKLILYKIRLDNYKAKKITLKLPAIKTNPKKTSFWAYKNHNKEGIYFASIFSSKVENGIKINVNVIKKDYYNSTLKKVNISFTRDNIARLNNIYSYNDYSFNENAYLTNTVLTGVNGNVYPDSKCAVKIDQKNECIYIYGMEQLKTNVKENHIRTIFIKKYNFDEELIWEFDIEGLNAGTGSGLSIGFIIKKDQSVRLSTSGIYWELSSKGEPMTTGATADVNGKKASFPENDKSPISKYWHEHKSRDKLFYDCSIGEYADVLIEHNDETGNIDVLLFKK